MRIITSLWPTSGFLTSVSVRPGARSSFANAFMCASVLDDTEYTADARECIHRAVDLFGRVRGAHLRTNACATFRHDREREADHVHAFLQERIGHFRSELRVAEHDRNDRMFAGHERETERTHLAAEVRAVFAHARAQLRAFFARQQFEYFQRSGGDARRQRV